MTRAGESLAAPYAQAGFSQEQAAVDTPHQKHQAVDSGQPASQEDVSYGSSWQSFDGSNDASHFQYQQEHDTVLTSESDWDQTNDHSETGPDTFEDELLSNGQGYV